MALITNAITTFPLTVKIDCPAAKGDFIAHAKIKTKPENKALLDRIDAGDMADDADLVRELFDKFEGLPCAEGQEFSYVLEGPLSAYLVPALIQSYYQQYGEARVGNSKPRSRR